MFKKKKSDKSEQPKGAAGPGPDSAANTAAAAPTPTASGANINSVGASQEKTVSLKASFGAMPAAGTLEAQAAMESAAGKRAKTSIVLDFIVPLLLSAGLCAGFVFTGKQVKNKTVIYGVPKEQAELVVEDKGIASDKVMAEVAQMEPLKLLAQGETAAAIAAAKQLAKDTVAKPLTKDEKAPHIRALLCAGQVLVDAGAKADREIGLGYTKQAFDMAKYSKYVRLMYARQLVRMHKDAEATEVYEKIIEFFPEPPWSVPHKELAALYMRTNNAEQAVTELQALIKTDPGDPGAQRELGLAMAQAGNQQDGFDEFQKGFTKEQDVLGYPYAVKDIVEAHAGIVASALSDAQKNFQKNPEDVHAMLTLARLYIASNKYKEAREVLEKARKVKELDPEVHELIAEVMVLQNQPTSAFDEFRMAVSNLHLKD